MPKSPTVPFLISHVDSLGQGVSKTGPKVTFIPKTLPGEEGQAMITAEKKGVAFARANYMTKNSPDRINPECPHFSECPSCHFLHTSYEKELEFKHQSLEKLFQKIPHPTVEVIPAVRRLGYRNRVQLHYDLKAKAIGLMDVGARRIAPIPQCKIGLPELREEIQRLYTDESWLSEAPQFPQQGHVEIYVLNGVIKKTWNQSYAKGGFTQVFEEMNQVLKKRLQSWWGKESRDLLDLFGGNGNLSEELSYSRRLCVDIYDAEVGDQFYSQSLYAEDAIARVTKKVASVGLKNPDLLIDPPRSGLSNLQDWLNTFRPLRLAYVSCDPHTLVRDLMPLTNYRITDLILLDFFPSTFHYETVVFLTQKD